MQKFEYRFITEDPKSGMEEFTERLNAFGYDGWELINVVPESDRNYLSAVFKRPLGK